MMLRLFTSTIIALALILGVPSAYAQSSIFQGIGSDTLKGPNKDGNEVVKDRTEMTIGRPELDDSGKAFTGGGFGFLRQEVETLPKLYQMEAAGRVIGESAAVTDIGRKQLMEQAASLMPRAENAMGVTKEKFKETWEKDTQEVIDNFEGCQDSFKGQNHTIDDLTSMPSFSMQGICDYEWEYQGPSSGKCYECVGSIPFICSCIYFIYDLIEYAFPTARVNVSEQRFQSGYVLQDDVKNAAKQITSDATPTPGPTPTATRTPTRTPRPGRGTPTAAPVTPSPTPLVQAKDGATLSEYDQLLNSVPNSIQILQNQMQINQGTYVETFVTPVPGATAAPFATPRVNPLDNLGIDTAKRAIRDLKALAPSGEVGGKTDRRFRQPANAYMEARYFREKQTNIITESNNPSMSDVIMATIYGIPHMPMYHGDEVKTDFGEGWTYSRILGASSIDINRWGPFLSPRGSRRCVANNKTSFADDFIGTDEMRKTPLELDSQIYPKIETKWYKRIGIPSPLIMPLMSDNHENLCMDNIGEVGTYTRYTRTNNTDGIYQAALRMMQFIDLKNFLFDVDKIGETAAGMANAIRNGDLRVHPFIVWDPYPTFVRDWDRWLIVDDPGFVDGSLKREADLLQNIGQSCVPLEPNWMELNLAGQARQNNMYGPEVLKKPMAASEVTFEVFSLYKGCYSFPTSMGFWLDDDMSINKGLTTAYWYSHGYLYPTGWVRIPGIDLRLH